MNLKEFQEESNKLIRGMDSKFSGEHDFETIIIHLLEELGEVARQLYNQKVGRALLDKKNLSEEISDCIILLSQLAHRFDIDLEEAIRDKLQYLRKRFNVKD